MVPDDEAMRDHNIVREVEGHIHAKGIQDHFPGSLLEGHPGHHFHDATSDIEPGIVV